MLILPQGYEKWKEETSIDESTGMLDKPTLRETGFKVTQEIDKRDDLLGSVLKWVLPDTFCADCGRKDISPEKAQGGTNGTYVFDEPRPDLQMRPGDVLHYPVCVDCYEASLWDDKSRLILPPSQQLKYRRAQRIGRNCQSYIKMLVIRGDKPLTEDHSYVRQQYY